MAKIEVKGAFVTIISGDVDDHISLTGRARYNNSGHTHDQIRTGSWSA